MVYNGHTISRTHTSDYGFFFNAQGSDIHFVNLRLCRLHRMKSTALIEWAAPFRAQQSQLHFSRSTFSIRFSFLLESKTATCFFVCIGGKRCVVFKVQSDYIMMLITLGDQFKLNSIAFVLIRSLIHWILVTLWPRIKRRANSSHQKSSNNLIRTHTDSSLTSTM